MEINKEFLGKLFEQAVENPRLRQSYDLRTTSDDNSQRILNTLLPGTVVPIHRHPNSNENVLLLCGKLVEVIYDENGKEKERILVDPTIGNYGCVIPPGAWHTVEVLEPSVIYEAKDGKYGEDGSETLDAFKAKVAEDKTGFSYILKQSWRFEKEHRVSDWHGTPVGKHGCHYSALCISYAECAT